MDRPPETRPDGQERSIGAVHVSAELRIELDGAGRMRAPEVIVPGTPSSAFLAREDTGGPALGATTSDGVRVECPPERADATQRVLLEQLSSGALGAAAMIRVGSPGSSVHGALWLRHTESRHQA